MEPQAKLDPLAETALRSLRDIVMPPPPSWLPQTWGWALAGTVLLFALAVIAIVRLRRYRANAYRREALKQLPAIMEKVRSPESRPDGIHALTELLKRTSIAAWPRERVAALSGEAWVQFLEDTSDAETGQALQRLLDDFEYHGEAIVGALPSNAAGDLVDAARRWIERHHVSA